MLIYYVNDIPTDLSDKIEEYISSQYIPWNYFKHSLYQDQINELTMDNISMKGFNIYDNPFFSSSMYWANQPCYSIDIVLDLSDYLINYFERNLICEKLRLIRILANMSFPKESAKGAIQYPHADCTKGDPYYTFLYYPIDSDGDTYFFDDNDELIAKASPLKGTGILFNSDIMHAGSFPVHNERRIAINFMFERLKNSSE